ncbi:MAG TPA: MFS transporter [Streptosporangiaceae bacterium]|nr:MFS transporter [Streptosporangiaceae bacterium]
MSSTLRGDLAVLSEQPFLFLFLARTVSLFGSAVALGALPFAVLGMHGGSATVLGLVLGARSLAQVALLLFGGVLADRRPQSRSRLMAGSDVLAFASQGLTATLFITGAARPAQIIVLAAVSGAASALFGPAAKGLVPQLVDGPRLQSANVLLRLSYNTTSVIGTALGGVLVVTIGAGWALSADAITFGVSAVLLAGIRLRQPLASGTAPASGRMAPASGSSVRADLAGGWREFTSRPWMCLVSVQFAIVNGGFGMLNVLGPVIAEQHMGGPAAWAGLLAAKSAGMIVGSLLVARIRPRFPVRTAVLATFGSLPPIFLFAAGAPVWLVGALMLVNGVTVDIFEVLFDTAMQTHVPREALSRIASYDAASAYTLGPLGTMLAGPLSEAIGASGSLYGAGALMTLAAITTFASRSVRQLPAEVTASAVPTRASLMKPPPPAA